MKKTIRVVGNIVLYLGIYMLMMLIMNLLFSVVAINTSFREWFVKNTGSLMIATNIGTIGALSLLCRIRKQKFSNVCGFTPINPKHIPTLVLLGASLGIFSTCVTQLPFIKESFPSIIATVDFITSSDNILILFFGPIIFGSLFEEILVRGFIFNELRTAMSLTPALILQGLVFGLIFINIPIAVYASIGALIFGLVYILTKTLWASTIAHMTSILVLALLGKFDLDLILSNNVYVWICASILTLVLALIVLTKQCNKNLNSTIKAVI